MTAARALYAEHGLELVSFDTFRRPEVMQLDARCAELWRLIRSRSMSSALSDA